MSPKIIQLAVAESKPNTEIIFQHPLSFRKITVKSSLDLNGDSVFGGKKDHALKITISLVEGDRLQQTVADLLREVSWVVLAHSPQLLALRVVHVSQVIERAALTQPVAEQARDLQVPLAALYGFRKLPHHLESIAEVARSFGLAEFVVHCSGIHCIIIIDFMLAKPFPLFSWLCHI